MGLFNLESIIQEYTTPQNIRIVGNVVIELLHRNQELRKEVADMLLYSDEGKDFIKKVAKEIGDMNE